MILTTKLKEKMQDATPMVGKVERKNLLDYYESLPDRQAPKTDFVREVCFVTGMTENTVRNWVKGRAKPTDKETLEYLSRRTGIPVERLFPSEEQK